MEFVHMDIRKGLVYVDNSMELMQELMRQYLDTGREQLEKLKQAYKEQDWKLYEVLVHALKSASLSIGAQELSVCAAELQKAACERQTETIDERHPRMLLLYGQVLEELEIYFCNRVEPSSSGSTCMEITKEQLSELLALLYETLDGLVTTEIEPVAVQMQQYSCDGIDLKERYRQIFAYIDDYEYETAMELVEEAMKSDV